MTTRLPGSSEVTLHSGPAVDTVPIVPLGTRKITKLLQSLGVGYALPGFPGAPCSPALTYKREVKDGLAGTSLSCLAISL